MVEEKIEYIVHQKYSTDFFQDQKRKITEIKTINENNNLHQNDKSLVVTPSMRSKNKNIKKEEEIKEINDTLNSSTKFEPINLKNKDLFLSLENFDSWDYSSFDYEIIDSEDVPIINSPFWPFEELGGYNKDNGVDIRNIVLKSVCQFNMTK